MSVLDRAALEASPLADLHAIAGELSIDSFRRLRKSDLIERIIARQEGSETDAEPEPAEAETPSAATRSRRRGRRGGRGRARDTDRERDEEEPGEGEESSASSSSAEPQEPADERQEPVAEPAAASEREEPEPEVEETVEGVVELLANGSGFVRVSPPEPSDQDVYISAAQVKRCELVSGDRISGPRRPPRRSERFASLVRIDTINGRPAAEVADGARYEDLPVAFPSERFRIGSDDPTLKAIEFLTPFGRGSRVTIVGGPLAGKSRALRGLAEALAVDEELSMFVVLAGVRPEELADWPADGRLTPVGALALGAASDALDHLVELVVDQARRVAARGANAVVVIDTLDGLHPQAARRAMAAARNIVDGGSLTVIATSTTPVGGETTVIALDSSLTAAARFPALRLVQSGTMRPELLVGEAGARAIAEARGVALDEAAGAA